jgi:hypothetical protein
MRQGTSVVGIRKSKPVEFLQAAGKLGMGSVILSLLSFGVTAWEHINARNVGASVFGFLTILLFCFGAYWAWSEERDRREAIEEKCFDERPKMGLKLISSEGRKAWNDALDSQQPPAQFSMQYLSGRVATAVCFDPIASKNGKYSLRFDAIPYVEGPVQKPMSFEVWEDGKKPPPNAIDSIGWGAMLVLFVADSPAEPNEIVYTLIARFRDGHDHLIQEFFLRFDRERCRFLRNTA